jgi:hypothetical protein
MRSWRRTWKTIEAGKGDAGAKWRPAADVESDDDEAEHPPKRQRIV